MAKVKRLPPAEAEVMGAVWQMEGSVTVRQVHSRLYPDGEKAYTTVQTVMNKLVQKGFLARQKTGMVNFYSRLITLEEAAEEETGTLVSRLFQGSFGALATFLVGSGELSQEELDDLKRLIDEKAEAERRK